MTDRAPEIAALLAAPADWRLTALESAQVRLEGAGPPQVWPRLPDAALRADLSPPAPDGKLSGWAVATEMRAPVAAILGIDAGGRLVAAARLARPDIRAALNLDYDMTGFTFGPPRPWPILFVLADGLVVKPAPE
ncbi:hypothetical protein ROJ8625_01544 [Roseivivax jejudonensis]|uniref:Uncharacterized protein n=1 Tax=Roseivivax jejudonensis TaxID=1529041 RepID=A0A1X6YWB6_9RHOB|nr:hypothetical protein [Roseivivax jejudonensis]SLN33112.1 hypothetical protein ROJ8625_01544 [Roseivivax jejudonensis]